MEKILRVPHGNKKYDFDKMEVGDTFPVKKDMVSNVRSAAYEYCKKYAPDQQFKVMYFDDNKYRCRRMK